jgi:hypothetical protein
MEGRLITLDNFLPLGRQGWAIVAPAFGRTR